MGSLLRLAGQPKREDTGSRLWPRQLPKRFANIFILLAESRIKVANPLVEMQGQ